MIVPTILFLLFLLILSRVKCGRWAWDYLRTVPVWPRTISGTDIPAVRPPSPEPVRPGYPKGFPYGLIIGIGVVILIAALAFWSLHGTLGTFSLTLQPTSFEAATAPSVTAPVSSPPLVSSADGECTESNPCKLKVGMTICPFVKYQQLGYTTSYNGVVKKPGCDDASCAVDTYWFSPEPRVKIPKLIIVPEGSVCPT